MTEVAGQQCDQCNTVDVVSHNMHRMYHPKPKRGWYVAACNPDPAQDSLWFCSSVCVIKYMAVGQ